MPCGSLISTMQPHDVFQSTYYGVGITSIGDVLKHAWWQRRIYLTMLQHAQVTENGVHRDGSPSIDTDE